MNTARVIKNAIRRLRKLERGTAPFKLPAETIRDLDRWIRGLLVGNDLTAAERRELQDFYISTLR